MQNTSGEATQSRQYFSMIEKAGSWNKYQLYMFFIFAVISITQSALLFIPPYLFYIPAYECSGENGENCKNFVCSLPIAERLQYSPQPSFNSLAQDLGLDFRCQQSQKLALFSMMVFFSSITGMMIFSTFTEGFGRKNSLVLSTTILLIGLFVLLLSGYLKSITVVMGGILLIYWGTENSYMAIYCFSSEIVSQKGRVAYINLLSAAYGLGILLNAATFWYIKEWTDIYLYIFIIPTIIVLLAVTKFIQKTPIDMLANESPQLILQTLARIARINQVQLHITLSEIQNLKEKYLASIKINEKGQLTCFDLFRYPSLLRSTIPLAFLNFKGMFLFSSPIIINNAISTSVFKESITDGVSLIIAIMFTYLLVKNTARRPTGIILSCVALIMEIILMFASTDKTSLIYLISYFAFRLTICTSENIIYQTNFETFPTQVRAVGSRFVVLCGTFAGIVQTKLISICQANDINVIYIFGVITLLGIVPLMYIKETYLVPPPEVIEELDCKHNEAPQFIQ